MVPLTTARNAYTKLNALLVMVGDLIRHPLLLLFRLYWGFQFFLTGKGKLMNHDKIVGYFTSLGIPLPEFNAWFVGCVECFGGLLLLVGLASRPAALFLASTMIVAYIAEPTDRATALGIFEDPAPFFASAPFLFLVTSLLVLAFGPGALSIDALIKRRTESSQEN